VILPANAADILCRDSPSHWSDRVRYTAPRDWKLILRIKGAPIPLIGARGAHFVCEVSIEIRCHVDQYHIKIIRPRSIYCIAPRELEASDNTQRIHRQRRDTGLTFPSIVPLG
jgi:hypothetical protein